MGQAHPKPNLYSSDGLVCTNLPPAPRTYSDDFWRQGIVKFSDCDMEALEHFQMAINANLQSEKKLRVIIIRDPNCYVGEEEYVFRRCTLWQ
ncbi:8818_t:CDS:2 [Ambispora gerdemannii]|uniref:8818_t:CDS:1 n=1 Tax=Ambispora gerdemannii TaxID=144530 RepID=A0A9N8ZSM9_9GLOM|nr:8818_t:CDS:2 [Ambispora gerdemannii]